MAEAQIRPYAPEDHEWLVNCHQSLYSEAEGFDGTFGRLVDDILAAHEALHDPDREAGWIAEEASRRLGSIFCVDPGDGYAKLRMFLVIPEARGTGLAQRLLRTCMTFAHGAGYLGMRLRTHESHKAAGRLYARNGFTLTEAFPTHSFGVDLVEQCWEIAF